MMCSYNSCRFVIKDVHKIFKLIPKYLLYKGMTPHTHFISLVDTSSKSSFALNRHRSFIILMAFIPAVIPVIIVFYTNKKRCIIRLCEQSTVGFSIDIMIMMTNLQFYEGVKQEILCSMHFSLQIQW